MLHLGLISVLVSVCMAAVVPETKESKLAQATNDLAFDLLRSYRNETNVFISPFSISTALALVYLGSEGTTAQEMNRVLKYGQYGLTPEEINQGFQALLSELKANTDDYQLSSYNNVLVDENFHILETYKKALKEYYSANTENVNFASQGEQVKTKINVNIERATNGKIRNFLEKPPSADTKLFLLNAVYFLGNWEKPFSSELTRESSFYNNGVQEKKVQMMYRNGVYESTWSKDLGASVVVLPYIGDHSANMVVVLPDSKTGIAELEKNISQRILQNALENTRAFRIDLYVPKFSLSYSTNLVEPLARLGLEDLFGNSADLSGIAGNQTGLKVSSILHKAVIDVNEKGSEASAATGIEAIPASLPPVIRIDHPFLFFIRECQSGMILFSGKVDEL